MQIRTDLARACGDGSIQCPSRPPGSARGSMARGTPSPSHQTRRPGSWVMIDCAMAVTRPRSSGGANLLAFGSLSSDLASALGAAAAQPAARPGTPWAAWNGSRRGLTGLRWPAAQDGAAITQREAIQISPAPDPVQTDDGGRSRQPSLTSHKKQRTPLIPELSLVCGLRPSHRWASGPLAVPVDFVPSRSLTTGPPW